jgi:NADPH:quinone reductase-like Zn-dependent oxidoreductase
MVVLQSISQYLRGMCLKYPGDIDWDLAAGLPVTSLTPYHALKEASLKVNEFLLVFGPLEILG